MNGYKIPASAEFINKYIVNNKKLVDELEKYKNGTFDFSHYEIHKIRDDIDDLESDESKEIVLLLDYYNWLNTKEYLNDALGYLGFKIVNSCDIPETEIYSLVDIRDKRTVNILAAKEHMGHVIGRKGANATRIKELCGCKNVKVYTLEDESYHRGTLIAVMRMCKVLMDISYATRLF